MYNYLREAEKDASMPYAPAPEAMQLLKDAAVPVSCIGERGPKIALVVCCAIECYLQRRAMALHKSSKADLHTPSDVIALLRLLILAFCICAVGSEVSKAQQTNEAVTQMPSLIGGLSGLASKLKYPESADAAGVEGQVLISFVVDKQGSVINPTVVSGIGSGCDEEALRVVSEARFIPGQQGGKVVKVEMTLPIVFELKTYDKVDEMPRLIGSLSDILQAVRYPRVARRAGVEGHVMIGFIVDEKGSVMNPTVTQSIGPLLDAEALRVVKRAKFKPGRLDGRPVKVRLSLPITFGLNR